MLKLPAVSTVLVTLIWPNSTVLSSVYSKRNEYHAHPLGHFNRISIRAQVVSREEN